MPIFHDPHDSPPTPSCFPQPPSRAGTSRLVLERDMADDLQLQKPIEPEMSRDRDAESPSRMRKSVFGRKELIDRIKRTKSPSWLHGQGAENPHDWSTATRPSSRDRPKTPLLPCTEPHNPRTSPPEHLRDDAAAGLEIERPRSALHAGDFREKNTGTTSSQGSSPAGYLATSPVVPWNRSFPTAAYPSHRSPVLDCESNINATRTVARARAASQSTISSFAFLPPTSPLVQQANNTDLEFTSRPGSRQASRSPDRASPLQHAPMVGSYEESILRGRMSTTPSRPLDFVAKIGVLGRGQCKSSLKCPPHVTVPFPAVFYSYNTGNGRVSDNEPSPYVGLIDLEHSLSPPEESNDASRRKRRHAVSAPDHDDLDFRIHIGEDEDARSMKGDLRRREKKKRRSTSPKAPPGGCYRIPPQGQLQIVLKNPNKTAVKLFLVPYDLSDMEPGQKTFIRQRSYSAGPILDMPISSRTNLGTDRPEAALSNSDDPNDRPILRYLIHLHICCPSRGRHYLYKSIRVVFANRVPDGKERLRNEIQQPEPRYSAYKPPRDAGASHNTATGIHLAADRRRSAGWPLSQSQQAYDRIDDLRKHTPLPPPAVKFTGGGLSSSTSSGLGSPMADLQPIPFSLTRLAAIESRPVSRDRMEVDRKSPFRTPATSPKPGLGSPNSQGNATFEKLNKGDVGYGGNAFSPLGSPIKAPNAGLLSQKLRGFGVQHDEGE
ncbi:hypothetical protein BDW02DRAFT_493584 [Decorospora gaudefroyi]|uniref:Atos-like conserved domain-containing protein n=1 Tax=Decorospora gaudefroyi TaxID=184978 RepID=A0A6A5KMD5_9PLEO|nr:hypothetical protein BDW02DRAFT_493584 [Decorospora gaudefroyi]